jgi:catechol-2,3-dioxygenase
MEIKELGHVVLFVKNIERSVHFYRDILGFKMVEPKGPEGNAIMHSKAVMFSSGRTHHELLLIEVGEDAPHPGLGHRSGLYHLGFKIGNTDDELREALNVLKDEGVHLVGASDHTVTHILYLLDPDDNEIELYIDVAGVDWNDASAVLAPTKALSL